MAKTVGDLLRPRPFMYTLRAGKDKSVKDDAGFPSHCHPIVLHMAPLTLKSWYLSRMSSSVVQDELPESGTTKVGGAGWGGGYGADLSWRKKNVRDLYFALR